MNTLCVPDHVQHYFGAGLTPDDMLRLDQLANIGALHKDQPAFIGNLHVAIDAWAWSLGWRETEWCQARPVPKVEQPNKPW